MNGPAEGDDSEIIMVNLCVAFGCSSRAGSGVSFHKVSCDKETQKLRLIENRQSPSKQPNLLHACVCSDHSLEEDYQFNYKLESEFVPIVLAGLQ